MKRMKKIIGCLVGVLLAAEAWAGGTLTLGSHVFTQGDSLHIELLLNLSDAKAGECGGLSVHSRAAWHRASARAARCGSERTSPCPCRPQEAGASTVSRLFASLPYALCPKPERQYYL